MNENDIRELACRENPYRTKSRNTSLEDINFLVESLSLVLDGWRKVVLQCGIIAEWQKENVPGVEEEVKGDGTWSWCCLRTSTRMDTARRTGRFEICRMC